jgi:hypothetical protein
MDSRRALNTLTADAFDFRFRFGKSRLHLGRSRFYDADGNWSRAIRRVPLVARTGIGEELRQFFISTLRRSPDLAVNGGHSNRRFSVERQLLGFIALAVAPPSRGPNSRSQAIAATAVGSAEQRARPNPPLWRAEISPRSTRRIQSSATIHRHEFLKSYLG